MSFQDGRRDERNFGETEKIGGPLETGAVEGDIIGRRPEEQKIRDSANIEGSEPRREDQDHQIDANDFLKQDDGKQGELLQR